MKLRSAQLRQHLQKNAAMPLYIVSGDEPLIIMECCDAIREHCKQNGYTEREIHHADAGFSWASVLDSANCMSLFGDRKLVEIRQDKVKIDEGARKHLIEYLQRPNPDTVLLVIWPKLEKSTTAAKWFQTLEALAGHVQVWPLEARDLPGWIEQRMRHAGLRPDRTAVTLLADRVQGNLLAAAQEIEKLKLLQGEAVITAEVVAQSVADHARYDIFSLVDSALDGNVTLALKMLNFCRASAEEPTVLLWAIARDVRTVCTLKRLVDKGMAMPRALQEAGVWEKRKPLIQKVVQRVSLREAEKALSLISAIDRDIKGWGQRDPWQGLSELILALGAQPLPFSPAPP